MRRSARSVLVTLQHAITSPLDSLNRWQRAARWLYDFGHHGWRQLSEDDAPSLAAALAYRMIFGLLPVLVVVTLTAKAFIGSRMPEVVDWVVGLLGANDVEISGVGENGGSMLLGSFLKSLVERASELNLAALGWVGGVVLIYSAISLMVTIENSFNRVMRAPAGRPWQRRIPLYWFVLTVGPILLGVTPYLNFKYAGAVEDVDSLQWLFAITKYVWNFAIIWAFMAALYLWVPNTAMQLRAVLVGAFVSAVLLEVGKRFLGAYLQHLVVKNPLIASLGLVPLVMFWIYAMWMVVLFGLEVTAMIQFLGGRRMEELEKARPRGEIVDPASVLALMQVAAARFREGQGATAHQLAECAGVPHAAAACMVDRLVHKGILHRLEQPADTVALARPAEEIRADELIKVGWELASTSGADSRVVGVITRLREAQEAIASGTTLEALAARTG